MKAFKHQLGSRALAVGLVRNDMVDQPTFDSVVCVDRSVLEVQAARHALPDNPRQGVHQHEYWTLAQWQKRDIHSCIGQAEPSVHGRSQREPSADDFPMQDCGRGHRHRGDEIHEVVRLCHLCHCKMMSS